MLQKSSHQVGDWPQGAVLQAADCRTGESCVHAFRQPLVSVIMPVFNREKSLSVALDSVANQTFSDWEVVVVDDCSSDNSAEVALRVGPPSKVRVIRHVKNSGTTAARNTGLLAARGRYVSFLDSDDSWYPNKLKRQVQLIQADPNPEMVLCVTQTDIIRGGGRAGVLPKRVPFPQEPWSDYLYVNGGYVHSNMFLLSRELALKVGFRSAEHEDQLFFLDLGALGVRLRLVLEPLCSWNDEARPDRLCLGNRLERHRRYIDEAGSRMTDRARLAYLVRTLGPALLKESPRKAMNVFREAVKKSAVERRHVIFVMARYILPPSMVGFLRRMVYLAKTRLPLGSDA